MRIAIILLMAGLITACTTTTEPDPGQQLLLIGSATNGSVSVDLYAEQQFSAGYQRVYIDIHNGTTRLTDAHVELSPLMDMGMMKHSCPTEQPGSDTDADGYFTGAVIFTMAGTAEQWSVGINVHDHSTNTTHAVTIPVTVEASPNVRVMKDGMRKTVITLVDRDWRVGVNDVEFLVHETMDGFAYAPVAGLTTTLEPTMPSMGHGSEGNINPFHAHDSWYTGRVNFTMTGEWDLALGLFKNEEQIAAANFLVQVR